MKTNTTPLSGLIVVETTPVADTRGRFTRIFCDTELATAQPNLQFRQINLSATRQRGTVRGLHYQVPPAAETKLIRCLRGRVFDVAVDLRRDSPTFLGWHAVELSSENDQQVLIPEGFAHGFQALTDDVELLYMHTSPWTPSHEIGIRHDDPRLGITWPLPVSHLSNRDSGYSLLTEDFSGVVL